MVRIEFKTCNYFTSTYCSWCCHYINRYIYSIFIVFIVWSSLFWFKYSSDKTSPHWQIRNQTNDVISNQTLNRTQSTDTYTSIWHHQSRTTLQSLCWTLWPQTAENTKSQGILKTNTRGRCKKWVKKDRGYLGGGHKVIESIRICTQL